MDLLTRQLVLFLVAAHVVGEFLLLPRPLVRAQQRAVALLGRALIVAATSYLAVGWWQEWRLPAAVFVLHTLVGLIQAHLLPRNLASFLADQAAHLVGLVGIALWLGRGAAEPWWGGLTGETAYDSAVVVAGLVLVTRGAGVAIGLAVHPFLDEMKSAGRTGGNVDAFPRGFAQGGRVIGWLERALILLLVLAGLPQGVGFLLAAKSILRFGDVRDSRHRMEAEYVIIGTLASFGAGLAIAFLLRHLLMETFHLP